MEAGDYTLSGSGSKQDGNFGDTGLIFVLGGTLTLQSGTIKMENITVFNPYAIVVRGGTFNMTGGKIDASVNVGKEPRAICITDKDINAVPSNSVTSKVVISGGEIESRTTSIDISGSGSTLTIKGGNLYTELGMCIYGTSGSTTLINDGNISGTSKGVYFVDSTAKIEGGTISGKNALFVQTSDVELSGGTFKGPIQVEGSTPKKVGDLLADGYAYNQDGKWLTVIPDDQSKILLGETITVGKITVKITKQPEEI